jgi:hypothetical protein
MLELVIDMIIHRIKIQQHVVKEQPLVSYLTSNLDLSARRPLGAAVDTGRYIRNSNT